MTQQHQSNSNHEALEDLGAGSSFRRKDSNGLGLADLEDIRFRVRAARRDALDLRQAIHDWRHRSDVKVEVSLRSGSPDIVDFTLTAGSAFPHQDWALRVGRILHDCRSALDNLNTLMIERYSVGELPRRPYFPITEPGRQWREWAKVHAGLPSWAIARYEAVQPWASPYHGLHGLQQLNNGDKHRQMIPVQVALVGKIAAFSTVVEGLVQDGEELLESVETGAPVLCAGQRAVRVASLVVNREVVSLDHDDVTPDCEIDPDFQYTGGSYRLAEVVELPRRVGLAVDYVATGDPATLDEFSARPAYVAADSDGDVGGDPAASE
ncbi:hypothetical protein P0L94_08160 [Microbacter sp. GSS18]|nr:hypothetical protein P0L94_08160 [Microbacter sp. GSS18]